MEAEAGLGATGWTTSTRHLCPATQESMRSPKHIQVLQTLIASLPHLQESLGIAPWLAQSIECHSSLSPMPQSPGTREGRGCLHNPPTSLLSHYPQTGPDPPLSPACNSGLAIFSASTPAPRPIFPCEPGELPEAPTTGLLSYFNLPRLPSAPSIKSPLGMTWPASLLGFQPHLSVPQLYHPSQKP